MQASLSMISVNSIIASYNIENSSPTQMRGLFLLSALVHQDHSLIVSTSSGTDNTK